MHLRRKRPRVQCGLAIAAVVPLAEGCSPAAPSRGAHPGFVGVLQQIESGNGTRGLPSVPPDRFVESERETVVQQAVPGPRPSAWRSPDLTGGKFGQRLNWNAVASPDIVQLGNRKSLNGRTIFLPRAVGTTNEPLLITVPADAVPMEPTWQALLQPFVSSLETGPEQFVRLVSGQRHARSHRQTDVPRRDQWFWDLRHGLP